MTDEVEVEMLLGAVGGAVDREVTCIPVGS